MEYITKNNLKIELVIGDIAKQDTVAVVNAANDGLWHGTGVCDAIYVGAGEDKLKEACESIISKVGRVKTSDAVITPGFNLKAKYIIHAVGPHYKDKTSEKFLANTYINSMKLAESKNIESITFPSISTGVFGYPTDEASKVAMKTLLEYNPTTLKVVRMCLYNDKSYNIYKSSLEELIK